jgi:hypothetical protein
MKRLVENRPAIEPGTGRTSMMVRREIRYAERGY